MENKKYLIYVERENLDNVVYVVEVANINQLMECIGEICYYGSVLLIRKIKYFVYSDVMLKTLNKLGATTTTYKVIFNERSMKL